MSPPGRVWPPAGNRRPVTSTLGSAVELDGTRPVTIDPATIRALAVCVPCDACDDRGLCSRCWVTARAVEQLTVAGRRDQAVAVAA